jgi:hypothetical protein
MRDILDKIHQVMIESVGLANRRPGDRWANDQGDEIIFSGLEFYPKTGSFSDENDMTAAISQVADKIGFDPSAIVWTNQPRGSRAFAIAHFVDAENQDYYLGRYFRSISANPRENSFPNDLPGGFRLQTSAAKKERSGYKPTEVLTRISDLAPQDIAKQIRSRFGDSSDEARAIDAFMSADRFPMSIPRGNMDFAAFTNYFAEMLQPMALVMGKPVTGNAQEAEEKFLTRGGFDQCKISFGSTAASGLTDSTLTNPAGQSIGLSSKAKSGAKASARNLNDKVQEMQQTEDGRKILENYPEEVAILKMIVDGGYIDGPLNLAMTYGLIDAEEKQQVKSLRKLGPSDVSNMISDRLNTFYQDRRAADPTSAIPFYHLLAAIAYQVADYINENTDFSRAASEILNHGAFMQAYTTATQRGDSIVLNAFNYQYPSTAVTDVLLSAAKTYFSTGNKGNFTFQILKNGATVADVEVQDSAVDTKPDVDLDRLSQKRSTVKAFREPSVSDEKSLGRKRRR